jgi:Glycosyl transferase family 2
MDRQRRILRPRPLARRPRVSVMIPLYNYSQFLGECVDSILTQDGVEVDLLIIDDASTDDSLAVAEAIAAADGRVRLVANERNIGMVPTINRGLWDVDAEYVVKFDADDVLTPGALARATALLDANPSVGFVYGFPVEFNSSPPPPARTAVRSWSIWSGHDWLTIRCRKGRNCIMQPEVVMRATALHEAGQYNTELPHGSDFEMWLRLATVADVGRVNGAHQGYYRVHDQSMQRTVHAGLLTDLRAHRDSFRNVLTEAGDRLPDADRLSCIARRAIAANVIGEACRAYDDGSAPEEPIDAFLALALDVYPGARKLSAWRSLERRGSLGPKRAQTAGTIPFRRLARDIEDRLRWRRWRWSGV